MLVRRDFLVRTGLVLAGTGAVAGTSLAARELAGGEPVVEAPAEASGMRGLFALDPAYVHMSAFLLAPHPRPVREAIERHRRALDANPKQYLDRELEFDRRVVAAAAAYLGAAPEDIALTDSTTMGLGLVYGTLRLAPGEEVLTTEHDHYSTHEALRLRAERTGARVRRVALYRDIGTVAEDEIVTTLRGALRPQTRAVALTWVHSSTGLKLPVRALADMLAEVNEGRDAGERVLLCVDGVHGLGADDAQVAELGADIFCAGCHKWLCGPRGTGIVWASEHGWDAVQAVIPPFEGQSYGAWMEGRDPQGVPPGPGMTPGGFHSFEHRWALAEAFELARGLGRERAAEHIRGLATQLKDGLARIPGVRLVTPRDPALSAGLVCFELERSSPAEVVDRLEHEHRVIATVTPYATLYARMGPSLVNDADDVERALRAVRALA